MKHTNTPAETLAEITGVLTAGLSLGGTGILPVPRGGRDARPTRLNMKLRHYRLVRAIRRNEF